jgi:chemotaxis protein methyltransferase CheR
VDAVGRASERISTLARRTHPPPSPAGVDPAPDRTAAPGVDEALAHLHAGRFAEALEQIETVASTEPGVLVVLAVLLTHLGQLARAEGVCMDLIQSPEHGASAHHLLALCREGQGDRDGAIDHERRAASIDPTFAMPRVHLGLLARRAGDRIAARRELEAAVAVLQAERSERVVLFGGGFGRDGLIALCQAELRRIGGAP